MKAALALRVVRTNNVAPLRERLASPSRRRPGRGPLIAGMGLSIALHAALLVALHAPRMAAEPPSPPALEVVLVEPPVPVVAPPPPKNLPVQQATAPQHVPVPPSKPRPVQQEKRHQDHPKAQAVAPPQPVPHEPAPALPPPAPLAIPRTEPLRTLVQPSAPATSGPSAVAPVEQAPATTPAHAVPQAAPVAPPSFNAAYLRNPAPAYPLIARRNGQQGSVILRVLVTRDGRPGSVAVQSSSGFPALDAAALATVREWRFLPAQQNGRAVDAPVLVPIVFRLRDAS